MNLFEGNAVQLTLDDDQIVTLTFDLKNSSVNKFNQATLVELKEALKLVAARSDIAGMLLVSGKPTFVVGADISEFSEWFSRPIAQVEALMSEGNATFSLVESLPFPVVAAINGLALGGGLEVTLVADFRVVDEATVVGLPEVSLGIFPGWGGTVRLPRIIGLEKGVQWVLSGKHQNAATALEQGLADQVVAPGELRFAARHLLEACINGERDWRSARSKKELPVNLGQDQCQAIFDAARDSIPSIPEPDESAPNRALECIAAHTRLPLAEALRIESQHFAGITQTRSAINLIRLFLNTDQLKRETKTLAGQVPDIESVLVLGAGIMGGGIAYQTSLNNIKVVMKDISQDSLDLGITQANRILDQAIKRGKVTREKADAVLGRIEPTLEYQADIACDLVIEAVVENQAIKGAVLAEVEELVPKSRVIASNTSSIPITALAKSLKYPDKFCGIHFFNPVHMMPCIEIIRGAQTSDSTIATAVKYANSIGKQSIVVNDCPGFLVNRILFSYLDAFERLVRDGADFRQVDRVMEQFGWPMGPAYLLDVVGLDTAHHVGEIVRNGYGERTALDFKPATQRLYEAGHLGQKSGAGYYCVEVDKNGRRSKAPNPAGADIIGGVAQASHNFSEDEIVDRMMIPMAIEAALCLEERIVDSARAADMGLIWGLGFPRFRGGALAWIDALGAAEFCQRADRYAALGPAYQVTEDLRRRARVNDRYYG